MRRWIRPLLHLSFCMIAVPTSTGGPLLGFSCVAQGHESICSAMIRADQVFSGVVVGMEPVRTTEVVFDVVDTWGTGGSTIEGIALDDDGGSIPGAVFELRDTRGNIVRKGVSNDEGRFRWSELPTGAYDLTGTLSGFDPVEIHVQLEAGRSYRLQASMDFQAEEFEFQVDRTWKSPLPERVRVRTSLSTAGFPFEMGRRYLVLAAEDSDGNLETGLCDGTRALDEAGRYLDLLDQLASGTFPDVIQGWVVDRTSGEAAPFDVLLADTRITIAGMGLRFQAALKPDGYFRTPTLPLGEYQVYADVPSGVSLANPEEWVTIGGDVSCPELGFELKYVTRTH